MTKTSSTKILNLALFGTIFLFYVLFIGIDILKDNFCGNTAVDYCAYWSVGQIINDQGFDQIYNFDSLQHYQQQIYNDSLEIQISGWKLTSAILVDDAIINGTYSPLTVP